MQSAEVKRGLLEKMLPRATTWGRGVGGIGPDSVFGGPVKARNQELSRSGLKLIPLGGPVAHFWKITFLSSVKIALWVARIVYRTDNKSTQLIGWVCTPQPALEEVTSQQTDHQTLQGTGPSSFLTHRSRASRSHLPVPAVLSIPHTHFFMSL